MKFKTLLLTLAVVFSMPCFSDEKPTLRIAVLAFGTVNWELATLKNLKQLENAGFQLKIQPVANPQAGKIALQSGAVDIIVSDWVWVSRLRSTGMDLSFYPYSTTSGALMVNKNSQIKTLDDLRGKKLGIAGGELDKNWLLLQALAKQQSLDLDSTVEKIYAAPPLLNQQLLHQRVDAIINYWHFAAKLEAKGYQQLLDGQDILLGLGIKTKVPTLGYVFNRQWANQHKTLLNTFLKSTQQAKNQLCQSDKVWQHIIPLTYTKDLATQDKLRQRYCAGRITQWGINEQQAAAKIYKLLHQLSHSRLTGHSKVLQSGTFWTMD